MTKNKKNYVITIILCLLFEIAIIALTYKSLVARKIAVFFLTIFSFVLLLLSFKYNKHYDFVEKKEKKEEFKKIVLGIGIFNFVVIIITLII